MNISRRVSSLRYVLGWGVACVLGASGCTTSLTDPNVAGARTPASTNFPVSVTAFLDEETPKLNEAVAKQDRGFFEDESEKIRAFMDRWNSNAQSSDLAFRYPACFSAVSDFLMVDTCRSPTQGAACDPRSYVNMLEQRRASCRALAEDR